uniref:Uncharacterized protein n=1 Tax=Cannabis sativa TaxID=3483 RepID=A0A803PWX7_CANSA
MLGSSREIDPTGFASGGERAIKEVGTLIMEHEQANVKGQQLHTENMALFAEIEEAKSRTTVEVEKATRKRESRVCWMRMKL